MCLTAVDLSWEENVPARILTGERQWDERLPVWSFVLLREAEVLLPAREHARPGHGGTLAHFQKLDKPIPGPESRGQKDRRQRKRQRCWFQPGVWGASGHGMRCGSPLRAASVPCPLGTAWKNQELGRPSALSSTSEMPRRPPTGVLAKRRHIGGRRGLVTAPPPGNPSFSLPHFLGTAQEDLVCSDR